MAVDYRKIRSITAREFISALARDGFFLRRPAGSHQRFQHTDGRRVTVTFHASSDTFPIGTLKSMVEQASWTEADLVRLKVIREWATD